MAANRPNITIFKCLNCGKSLRRFSFKTYRQTSAFFIHFKCPCCRAKYEDILFLRMLYGVMLVFLIGLVEKYFRDVRDVMDALGYLNAITVLLIMYFYYATCPVKQINRAQINREVYAKKMAEIKEMENKNNN